MWLEIIVLVLAIPVGYLISWLCKDELIQGRKWFKILIIAGVIGFFGGFLYGKNEIGWTFGFIAVVSFISYWKSFDKKWIKKQ